MIHLNLFRAALLQDMVYVHVLPSFAFDDKYNEIVVLDKATHGYHAENIREISYRSKFRSNSEEAKDDMISYDSESILCNDNLIDKGMRLTFCTLIHTCFNLQPNAHSTVIGLRGDECRMMLPYCKCQ